jgi:hypothetical protein
VSNSCVNWLLSSGEEPDSRPRVHKSVGTKFVTMTHDIISIITDCFPRIQKRVSVHMHRTERAREVRCVGHAKIAGLQYVLAACGPSGA